MANNEDAESLLTFLTEKGVKPCGLGSRDTLRLEASLPLYGFELTEDCLLYTSPSPRDAS